MKRPLILISNDDGITAPGIKNLVDVARNLGDVVVVAPDGPQSGQSHSITIMNPIKFKSMDPFDGIEAYACSGTPVDCVKIARHTILADRKIDLCISGINHGSNASINVLYSGTMAAAMEAALYGTNAIGFSLLDFNEDANFEPGKPFIHKIIKEALENGLGKANLLNVNIPKEEGEMIKGIKICKQAKSSWTEGFELMVDPRGNENYWMTGDFEDGDLEEDTDVWALNNNYISVVPCTFDLTDYAALESLKRLEA